ncbi:MULTISPECIES: VirK family protein [unclassified Bradyrhizobium]|uniref:VirK family protein n=1 Tax=unclassified Bradyrhizobium TaxID=2631580 RepID=UPI0020B3D209|nr:MULTISPECIES: VirK family protein [unclassified Bradyrhizobium]MCP3402727.1 VirK family protein [Bradyrhizobium sp. CCGB20]MCP3411208.1 VirK family protein [Bradyrhizobium sp. CCGB01]
MSNYLRHYVVALAIVSSFWTRHAIADEPGNAGYAALNKAILEGKEPRMLIDLSACQVHGANIAGPSIKASMRFDGYMIQSDGTIAFATTHFTVRPDRSVREFLSFRVHADGKIEARTMTLGAVNYVVLKDTAFDCQIGKGATFHW